MISINFVIELPKSTEFYVVMTIMNLVSKTTYFIPTHTIVSTERVTRLFLYNGWKLHNLPTHVVFNYRFQSIALFTKKLYHFFKIEVIYRCIPQWDLQVIICVLRRVRGHLCQSGEADALNSLALNSLIAHHHYMSFSFESVSFRYSGCICVFRIAAGQRLAYS